MGGIVGLIGDGTVAELESMAARMPYRGSVRTWSPAPRVLLGELALGDARSPVASAGCFAFDTAGETTSRDEIERILQKRGPAGAVAIRGFFAIAWWDDASRSLRLICDRHGYKTLYIARLPGRIALASDLKALLALADVEASVDRDVLQMYLRSRSFPAERSLLASAQPIGGANVWTLELNGDLRCTPYWTPVRRVMPGRSFDAAALELRGILEQVLHRQLAGRERIALALSGGLDSASVLAMARRVRPDLHITTYTVGHGRDDPEIVRAREAAAHYGTEHHECFLPPEKVPAEMRRLVALTEDLTGREEAALQQVLAGEMSLREREYLVGHGADVAFAGMPRHRLMWLRDRCPPPLRAALDEVFVYTQRREEPRSWLGRRLASLAFRGDRPAMPSVTHANEIPANMNYASLDEYCCSTIAWIEGMRFHEPVEMEGDVTMIAPFFDPAVVAFALSCPTRFLIDARKQKRVLRAAMRGVLPPSISERGKLIQRMKHDTELSDVLDDFAAQIHLRDSLAARGLVAAEYLATLQKRPHATPYSSERLHILWAAISAELWLRHFIDRRGAPEGSRAASARQPINVPATASANQPAPIP
ncbi:MAG TPA: asparagine synthase-related protein [Steroidobacteraceae bacterium]|jgi:asparagine synthase (glutamine-hydrolysing)|nr:asparagine synthase-related protein [Steroidobacteraceae bacterium]